jgi:tetratricopeptide (TPR) repeat protein
MAQTWGVRGYPTLILMKSDGTEIDRIPGFAPPEDLIQAMNDFLAGRGTLNDLEVRYAKAPDSLGLLFAIGEKYQYRGKDNQAESCFVELITADPDNVSGVSAQALHSMALIAYSAGSDRYDSAIARFQAVTTRYAATDYAADAMTYIPYLMAKQERYEEALSLYEKFLKDYPESSEVDWVNRQIDAIKQKGI